MKTFLCRVLPLGLALLALNSCVGPMPMDGQYSSGPSYGPSYASDYDTPYYNDSDFYYYEGGPRPYYMGGYTSVIVGNSYYRGRGSCPICHHSPCYGHNGRASSFRSSHHDYGHDDHRYVSSSHSSGPFYRSSSPSPSSGGHTLYRHESAGNNRGAPQGEHSKDWYKDHGYSTSRLVPVQSSSSSHSSSGKKKDDDDHHHR